MALIMRDMDVMLYVESMFIYTDIGQYLYAVLFDGISK